jgi:hypothetical protein
LGGWASQQVGVRGGLSIDSVRSSESGTLEPLAEPVHVADPSDGNLVHQAGLNLSRAWTLRALSRVLERPAALEHAAARHEAAGLASVPSGEYAGDHWLASFAVYLLT